MEYGAKAWKFEGQDSESGHWWTLVKAMPLEAAIAYGQEYFTKHLLRWPGRPLRPDRYRIYNHATGEEIPWAALA